MSVMEAARELSRRRMLAKDDNQDRDFKAAYAECTFLDLYGRVPTLDDLRYDNKRLNFVPRDDDERTIRVISWSGYPFRVYSFWMDADVYVFAKTGRLPQDVTIVGWLEKQQVEECAKVETPSKYVKGKSWEAYEVDTDWLMKMPTDFKFVDPCPHFGQWGGIWDYDVQGWECFGCGRFLADRETRELVARDAKSEQHDQGSEATQEPLS